MRPLLLAGLAVMAFDAPAFADDGEMPPVHPHSTQSHSAVADASPFRIEAAYTADVWHTAPGNTRNGSRYLDNFDLMAEADLEALVGWQGATAFGYILYNNGNSLSDLMGDAQVASNIETGVQAVRLYEAWIDQKLGESASLRVGLYDLNSEFDALETSSLFMGSAHGIGTDISQTGNNGPSIFPATSLAARLNVDLSSQWKVRAALLDGVPGDPNRPRRTAIKLGNGDGALLIGEIERAGTNGRLIAGYWRYTAQFDRITGGTSRNNDGYYLRGEARLTREADETQGLAGFFRLGFADGQINRFAGFASAGLTYTGLFPGRNQDQIGLAVATAFVSARARQEFESTSAETAIELTYLAPITEFLSVQPNIQYVISPSANRQLSNALALGIRVSFSWSN
jgi:porin